MGTERGHNHSTNLVAPGCDRGVHADPGARRVRTQVPGMHHLSDVLVGAINGLVCAGLAYALMSRSLETTD
jgi:hypothetical protein